MDRQDDRLLDAGQQVKGRLQAFPDVDGLRSVQCGYEEWAINTPRATDLLVESLANVVQRVDHHVSHETRSMREALPR